MSTVLALITSTNEASRRLFTKAGYQQNGSMRAIGHKLGHLVDLDILQRLFPENFARYDVS
jgi:phosphinothricin acetyltransferase